MTKYLKDLLERMFWTGAEAAVAIVSVDSLDIPKTWVIPIAIVLAMVKGVIAKHVGDDDSASTVKGV